MADVNLRDSAVSGRSTATTDLIFTADGSNSDASAAFKADTVAEFIAFVFQNPPSALTDAQQLALRTLIDITGDQLQTILDAHFGGTGWRTGGGDGGGDGVGQDAIDTSIATHNSATDAHSDIRTALAAATANIRGKFWYMNNGGIMNGSFNYNNQSPTSLDATPNISEISVNDVVFNANGSRFFRVSSVAQHTFNVNFVLQIPSSADSIRSILGAATTSNAGYMTTAQVTKLAGVENNAKDDQTGTEIVSAIDTELGTTDWKSGLSSLGAGAVNTTALADGAVTTDKIADDAVTTAKIASSAVVADSIADGTITSAKFATGALGDTSFRGQALHSHRSVNFGGSFTISPGTTALAGGGQYDDFDHVQLDDFWYNEYNRGLWRCTATTVNSVTLQFQGYIGQTPGLNTSQVQALINAKHQAFPDGLPAVTGTTDAANYANEIVFGPDNIPYVLIPVYHARTDATGTWEAHGLSNFTVYDVHSDLPFPNDSSTHNFTAYVKNDHSFYQVQTASGSWSGYGWNPVAPTVVLGSGNVWVGHHNSQANALKHVPSDADVSATDYFAYTGSAFQKLSTFTAAVDPYTTYVWRQVDQTSNDTVGDASITTAKLADDAVTTAKIADDAVTNDQIGNLAVGTAQLAANAVTAAKLHPNAVQVNVEDVASQADLNGLTSGDVRMARVTTAFGSYEVGDTLVRATHGDNADTWHVAGKTGSGGGNSVSLSDDDPQGPGTAAEGTSTSASRSDHVHPLPTGSQIKTAYEAESDTNAYTDAEKTRLGNIRTFFAGASDVTYATATIDSATSRRATINLDELSAVQEGDIITFQWRDGVASAQSYPVYVRVGTSGDDYPLRYSEGTTDPLPQATWGQMSRFGYLTIIKPSGPNYYVIGGPNHILGGANLGVSRGISTVSVTSNVGTNAAIPAADASLAGVMTAADRTKLDGIEASAKDDQTGTEIVAAIDTELGSTAWKTGGGGTGTLSDDDPQPPGTAAEGTSTAASRSDHVHPLPTGANLTTILEALTGDDRLDNTALKNRVAANPGGSPSTNLSTITIDGTDYTVTTGDVTISGTSLKSAVYAKSDVTYDATLLDRRALSTALPWPSAANDEDIGIPLAWAKIAGDDGLLTIATSEPADSDLTDRTYDVGGTDTNIDYAIAHFRNASSKSITVQPHLNFRGSAAESTTRQFGLRMLRVSSGSDDFVIYQEQANYSNVTDVDNTSIIAGHVSFEAVIPPGNDDYYIYFIKGGTAADLGSMSIGYYLLTKELSF